MKAITLWQPWASLIATGAKTFETRSWKTTYRGPLVICSAKGGLSKSELIHHLCFSSISEGLASIRKKPADPSRPYSVLSLYDLPKGYALCVVNVVDCKKTDDLTQGEIGTDKPVGDFSLGRYAWKLDLLYVFAEPFPVKGQQGFFNVDIPAGAVPEGIIK